MCEKQEYRENNRVHNTSGGFTLIEMLVVISIIGALAGMLAGPLMSARDEGRRVSCCNQMKQIYAADSQYMFDNNGKSPFPMITYSKPKKTSITWSQHLTGGVEVFPMTVYASIELFRCSAGNYSEEQDQMQAHTIGKFDIFKPTSSDYAKGMEYSDMPSSQWAVFSGSNGFMRYDRIKSPGKFMLYADAVKIDENGYQFYRFNPHRYMISSHEERDKHHGAHLRHNGQVNATYADGHVDSCNKDNMAAKGLYYAIDKDLNEITAQITTTKKKK